MLPTHIMQEVEAVCTRVMIINKGMLAADGPIDQLKGGQIAHKQTVMVEFNNAPDISLLQNIPGLLRLEQTGKASYLAESAHNIDLRPLLFQFAVSNNLILLTLKEQQQSLENVFQELTR